METVFNIIRTLILFPIVFIIKWIFIVLTCIFIGPFIYTIRNLCVDDYKPLSYICEWVIKDFFDTMVHEFFDFY